MHEEPKSWVEVALGQFDEGYDFDAPAAMLRPLSAEAATSRVAGAQRTVAEIVAHAEFWQRRWLDRLEGRPVAGIGGPQDEWPNVSAERWAGLREAFLHEIEQVRAHARSHDPAEALPSGEVAGVELLRIALHGAYHLGQVALLLQLVPE